MSTCSGRFLSWPRPHPFEQAVAVDPVVLERRRHVQQRDAGEREGAVAMQRLQHRLGKIVIDGHEVGQRQHPEPRDRHAHGRAVGPSGQRHGEEQQVHQRVADPRAGLLQARHVRRQRGRPVPEPPQQPQRRQREDGHARPLVPVVDLQPQRRERQPRHVEPHAEGADDQYSQQPVQRDRERVVAQAGRTGGRRGGGHVGGHRGQGGGLCAEHIPKHGARVVPDRTAAAASAVRPLLLR